MATKGDFRDEKVHYHRGFEEDHCNLSSITDGESVEDNDPAVVAPDGIYAAADDGCFIIHPPLM